MKLIIEISQEDFDEAKILFCEGVSNNIEYAVANGKPYEEITNEDIQTAIKQGYKDGYEMAKAKYERPQVECKDCKYFFDTVGRCENCNRNHWYSDNFIRKSI